MVHAQVSKHRSLSLSLPFIVALLGNTDISAQMLAPETLVGEHRVVRSASDCVVDATHDLDVGGGLDRLLLAVGQLHAAAADSGLLAQSAGTDLSRAVWKIDGAPVDGRGTQIRLGAPTASGQVVGGGGNGTAPDIDLSPTSFDADLLVGETWTQTLSVANTGASELTFSITVRPVATAAPAPFASGSTEAQAPVPQPLSADYHVYHEAYQAYAANDNDNDQAPPLDSPPSAPETTGGGGLPGFVFFDDMEHGVGGWVHHSTHPSGVDLWSQSSARSSSGSTSWHVGQHDFEGADVLQTPEIDLIGLAAPLLTFLHWYNFDDCAGDPTFEPDGGIVEVSVDGGTTWVQIDPIGGYPWLLDDICANPLAFRAAYSHDGGDGDAFVPAGFDLAPYAGQRISIRFHAGWDCGNCEFNEGWYIDDVAVLNQTPPWLFAEPLTGTVPPGGQTDVSVTFDATGLIGGDYEAEIAVASNDPDEPDVVIPAHLNVTGVPDISLSTALVDFGSVVSGTSRSLTIAVTNRGTDLLTVSGVTTDTTAFSVETASFTLLAGASHSLMVTFSPTSSGPLAGTLTIESDDPDTPVTTINLLGEGAEPPVMGVSPSNIGVELFSGQQATQTLTLTNSGGSPLNFSLIILPRVAAVSVPGAGLSATSPGHGGGVPSGDERAVQVERGDLHGTASDFELLSSSPVPLTCVVADPSAGLLYAQAYSGTAFYRYRASTDAWEPLASAPLFSGNNGGAALLNGKVYTSYTQNSIALGVYDIATNTWSTMGNPLGRGTANIASDGVQYLYLVEGTIFARLDPVTFSSTFPAQPPFFFQPWGGLRHFAGSLYGHQGNQETGFARYDIAAASWTALSSLPEGGVAGAAIDPFLREYFAYGPYGGQNLYRYSIDLGSWTVSSIPFFGVNDGGMGWLPAPVPGIYFVQGEAGTGLARLATAPGFVFAAPSSGSVPAGGSVAVEVQLDAAGLIGGVYEADIQLTSNDPVTPLMTVPVALTVIGAPDIAVSGEEVSLESIRDYSISGALTQHSLAVSVAPAGGGTFELVVDGDYGDFSETATAAAEGVVLGAAGATGTDCTEDSGTFGVSAAQLAALVEDGVVQVQVQNTSGVDTFCAVNRHTVRLRYAGPADALAFGSLFVGLGRVLTITLNNTGTDVLEVMSITSDRGEFVPSTASLSLPPLSSQPVAITFTPSAAQVFDGTLTIQSNDPDTPMIGIALHGEGLEPPVVGVSPSSLEATLLSGQQETQTLTVSNSGGSPLSFSLSIQPRVAAASAPGAGLSAQSSGQGNDGTMPSDEKGKVPAERENLRGTAGDFALLSPSPVPLTCVVADPGTGLLYAQANTGTAFYRYRASTDAWEPLANAPLFSGNNGGAALLNGKIYTSYVGNSSGLGVYDIATNMWSTMSNPLGQGTVNIASDGVQYLYLVAGASFVRLDPVTLSSTFLQSPPFFFQQWGGLRHLGASLYGHQGSGQTGFARYDIAAASWTVLSSLPGGGAAGAAIDPLQREYFAYGPDGGVSLYRYSIDSGSWTTASIPFFSVSDGGMGWLSTPVPGIYFVQGEAGTGLARLGTAPAFVIAAPSSGSVPAGGFVAVEVQFDAAGLFGGVYEADIQVTSDDPVTPLVTVPVALTVIGAPDIVVSGEEVSLESSQDYSITGALTQHSLAVSVAPAGGGTVELIADGDYGDSSETATATAEGVVLGTVGPTGVDCTQDSGVFPLNAAQLAALVADGVVQVQVQNTANVDAFCAVNRHMVRLRYAGPADALDFGSLFVGLDRALTITLRNAGTDVLEVGSITSDLGEFVPSAGSLSLPPLSSQPVTIAFTPSSAQVFDGTLTIQSNDPDSPLIGIALHGEGLIPPDISVSPASLSEDLISGQTSTQALTLFNTGGSELDFEIGVGTATGAAVLIVQDVAPWGSTANQDLLSANGISFDMISSSALLSTNLSAYQVVLVPSDQTTSFYTAVAARAAQLAGYVNGGGVLEFHAAGWGFSSGNASLVTLPGGMNIHPYNTGTNDVLDQEHPLMVGVPDPFFGTAASHAYFSNIPVDAAEVAADDLGRTNLVVYRVGLGWVVAGGQTFEYGHDNGQGPGLILANMIPYTHGLRDWLSVDPRFGVVPAGGSTGLSVSFDASGLLGGDYEAAIPVSSNDPDEPEVVVPVHLHVTGIPDIEVSGAEVSLESIRDYSTSGATTQHSLAVSVPPADGGVVELIVDGVYGSFSATATATAEGVVLGTVGATGTNCTQHSGTFGVSAAQLAALVVDGVVQVQVQNTSSVTPSCAVNRHTVRLRYAGPADALGFGSQFVGLSRTLTINLNNRGTDVLEVGSITSDLGEFVPSAGSLSLPPLSSRPLTVTFTPSSVGVFDGTLTIQSNDPDEPVLTVALHGEGIEPPVVGVSPLSVEATLLSGQQETQTLTVSNSGGSSLNFTLTIEPRVAASVPGAGLSAQSPGQGSGGVLGDEWAVPFEQGDLRGTDSDFEVLSPSPVPMTCVVADPGAGLLYAQANTGTAFYRYRASTDAWEPLASAPLISGNNGGAALLHGKVYTSYAGNHIALGVYDIATNTWSTMGNPLGQGTANIASDGVQYLYLVVETSFVRLDPVTLSSMFLPPPPFFFQPWGGLRHLAGSLYGHQGNGQLGFARYDIAAASWAALNSLPEGGVAGAAIDPLLREYFAYGPYGGQNLYRYSIDSGSWTVSSIPFFPVDDGGMGWLPAPVPGIYFVRGQAGTGLARLATGPRFVSVAPASGSAPAGGSAVVEVRLDTAGLFGGVYGADIQVASNDPVTPLVTVPVTLTVIGAPDIAVSGEEVQLESIQDYSIAGALTQHSLAVSVAPVGGGTFELIVDGDYGDSSETATAAAEGIGLGTFGPTGADCTQDSGTFGVSAAQLAALVEDGVLQVQVQNTSNVDAFCELNRHTVRLRYAGPADALEFGSLFVGLSRALNITLRNAGTEVLEVGSITSDLGEFIPSTASLLTVA